MSAGSAGSRRAPSQSPSKARHQSLCSRPRLLFAVLCCSLTFSLLLIATAYEQREVLWRQIATVGGGMQPLQPFTHTFRTNGIVLASAAPTPADGKQDKADALQQPVVAPGVLQPAVQESIKQTEVPLPPSPLPGLTPDKVAAVQEPRPPSPPPSPAVVSDAEAPSPPVAVVKQLPPLPPLPPAPVAPYAPNAVMTQSVFPKTADGYPLFSAPKSRQYSSFYCIGGRGRENAEADRSCRWQNLCYRPSTDRWLFYQDPASKGSWPVVLMDHGVVQTSFPPHFLNLRSMGIASDAQYWAPEQVFAAIPAEAAVPRVHADRADVYLLYHPHYPSNIGHVIGDDFFPLFNLQQSFGMLSNDAQLLLSRDCERIFLPGAPKKAEACHRFMGMLTPGMTGRPWLAATQPDLAEKLGMKAGTDLLCFENVLAGSGPWGFQQSLGKAAAWWQYHAFYLSNLGLSPSHTPRRHRITVSVKDGKRSIYNNGDMVAHLQAAFPQHQVEAVELYELGGWRQELSYLLDTTVLITPCGGVSMSAMFLPHGSALVVVDYWHVTKNNSVGMEERLWANLGYVRPFHYPFTAAEVVLDEPGRRRDSYQDMRDWGRVRVDLKRMETVVRAAVQHVDSFMTMGLE